MLTGRHRRAVARPHLTRATAATGRRRVGRGPDRRVSRQSRRSNPRSQRGAAPEQLPRQHHRAQRGVFDQPDRAGRHAASRQSSRATVRGMAHCEAPARRSARPARRRAAARRWRPPPRLSAPAPVSPSRRSLVRDRVARGGEFEHDRREPGDGRLVPRAAIHGRDEVARVPRTQLRRDTPEATSSARRCRPRRGTRRAALEPEPERAALVAHHVAPAAGAGRPCRRGRA